MSCTKLNCTEMILSNSALTKCCASEQSEVQHVFGLKTVGKIVTQALVTEAYEFLNVVFPPIINFINNHKEWLGLI